MITQRDKEKAKSQLFLSVGAGIVIGIVLVVASFDVKTLLTRSSANEEAAHQREIIAEMLKKGNEDQHELLHQLDQLQAEKKQLDAESAELKTAIEESKSKKDKEALQSLDELEKLKKQLEEAKGLLEKVQEGNSKVANQLEEEKKAEPVAPAKPKVETKAPAQKSDGGSRAAPVVDIEPGTWMSEPQCYCPPPASISKDSGDMVNKFQMCPCVVEEKYKDQLDDAVKIWSNIRTSDEQYQDIWYMGQTFWRGRRPSDIRYQAIRKAAQEVYGELDRPMKVLDIGASLAYFSARLAEDFGAYVMDIEGWHVHWISSVIRNNHLENQMAVVRKTVMRSHLLELAKKEQFDLVLAMAVIHNHPLCSDNFKLLIDALLTLGRHAVIELPYAESTLVRDCHWNISAPDDADVLLKDYDYMYHKQEPGSFFRHRGDSDTRGFVYHVSRKEGPGKDDERFKPIKLSTYQEFSGVFPRGEPLKSATTVDMRFDDSFSRPAAIPAEERIHDANYKAQPAKENSCFCPPSFPNNYPVVRCPCSNAAGSVIEKFGNDFLKLWEDHRPSEDVRVYSVDFWPGARRCEERYGALRYVAQRFDGPFKALDVGTDAGYWAIRLTEDFQASVTAFGSSNGGKAWARSLFIANQQKRVVLYDRLVKDETLELVAGTNPGYDMVYALGMLDKEPFKGKSLDDIVQLLKRMGRNVVVEVPAERTKETVPQGAQVLLSHYNEEHGLGGHSKGSVIYGWLQDDFSSNCKLYHCAIKSSGTIAISPETFEAAKGAYPGLEEAKRSGLVG